MTSTSVPVFVRACPPPQRRSGIQNVSVGGLVIVGQCILCMIILGSIFLFVGIVMAAAGTNTYYSLNNYRYSRTNSVRKGGIALIIIGGITLIVGVALAFKSSQDSKTTPGIIISPVQGQIPHNVQNNLSGYPSSYSVNQLVVPASTDQRPMQGYASVRSMHSNQNLQFGQASGFNPDALCSSSYGDLPPPYEPK